MNQNRIRYDERTDNVTQCLLFFLPRLPELDDRRLRQYYLRLFLIMLDNTVLPGE